MLTHSTPLDDSLVRFWEIEEILGVKPLLGKERLCENHFTENIQRNIKGRYIVKLPFNEKLGDLGQSQIIAQRRVRE